MRTKKKKLQMINLLEILLLISHHYYIVFEGRWLRGTTPTSKEGGYTGAGGPRGAISCSRSGGGGEEIPLLQGKKKIY